MSKVVLHTPCTLPPHDGFPHYENKYMCDNCCCGTVHCMMGARRIGIFMAIGLGFTLAGFVLRLIQPNDLNSQWDTEFLKIFFLVIEAIGVIFLFIGLRKMNPRMVLPVVLIWAFTAGCFILLIMGCIFAIIFPHTAYADYLLKEEAPPSWYVKYENDTSARRGCFFFTALVACFPLVLHYWFFNVTYRCYTYLKDFEEHRKRYGAVGVELGAPMPIR